MDFEFEEARRPSGLQGGGLDVGHRTAPSEQEGVRGPDTHEPGVLPTGVGWGGLGQQRALEGQANQTRTLEAMKRKATCFMCQENPARHLL